MSVTPIDQAILSSVRERWSKVAMIIAKVAKAMGCDLPQGDDGYALISLHIEALVRDGRLVAQGNTKNWRFSEVRRPN